MSKSYIAFYTFPIFWVDKDRLIKEIEENRPVDLTEKIFEKITPDHEIVLLRGGLILYREQKLESEYQKGFEITKNNPQYFPPVLKVRKKYLRIINLINFLLDCSNHYKSRNNYGDIWAQEFNLISFYRVTLDSTGIRLTDYSRNSMSLTFFNRKKQKENLEEIKRVVNHGITKEKVNQLFEDMYNDLLVPIINDENIFQKVMTLIKCYNEYKMENYRTSFVLGWFLIEFFISELFNDFITRINKSSLTINPNISNTYNLKIPYTSNINTQNVINRHNKGDFISVANKIEILNDHGMLILQAIDLHKFRLIRNEITHTNTILNNNSCMDLLKMIRVFSKDILKVYLPFNYYGQPTIGL